MVENRAPKSLENSQHMSENLTACECRPKAFPFFCARHGCTKIERWFTLCRTEAQCFANWEAGHGHGQAAAPGATEPPAFIDRVWNFAKAVALHVAGGCLSVSTEEYAGRLRACEGCSDRSENVCLQCGCYITIKAHWREMQCPLNKWPTLVEAARDGPYVG
jgi:hypothetical protein